MKKILMFILIVITGVTDNLKAQTGSGSADKSGWQKIGDRMVDLDKETDEITFVGSDRWASIKFKVAEAPIKLIRLEIFFEIGNNQIIKLNNTINAAGESKVIDLKGGERNLKKIAFTYKTLPNRTDKLASIEVFGRKEALVKNKRSEIKKDAVVTVSDAEQKGVASTLYGTTGNPSSDSSFKMPATLVTTNNEGWEKIGERTVDFDKARDEIMIFGTNRFAKIKFRTLDVNLNVTFVEMQFDGGLVQKTSFDTPLEQGKDSKEILLDANVKDHNLEKITFYYKSFAVLPGDNKARIEVWGYKLKVDLSKITK